MNRDRRSPGWCCGNLSSEVFESTRSYFCTACQVKWANVGGKK